jgi:hypothetical protein
VTRSRPDILAERDAWYAKRRAASAARVKIALSCARDGLKASTAMKLLNQTMDD